MLEYLALFENFDSFEYLVLLDFFELRESLD